MPLHPAEIARLAERLDLAERRREPIAPLSDEHPDLSAEDGYRIQLAWMARRMAGGARVVGKKIGLTSRAMQELLGVFEPDYGHLLDGMMLPPTEPVALSRLIQPKVEGELAFVLDQGLRGPGVTVPEVLAATRLVVPALEIVDSRVRDWRIRLPDTVADNASSGLVLLGEQGLPPDGLELGLEGMALELNGAIRSTGTGAAVLGHPAVAVAWLANKLGQFGVGLEAGEVILSGAITAAVSVQPGDVVTARFDHLGSVTARFQ